MGEQSQTNAEYFPFVLPEDSDFEDSHVLPISADCTVDPDANMAA